MLEDICLEVAEREILVLLGPSGCGKSTLLNLVAGLLTPTAGTLAIAGAPERSGQPDSAVVFQDFALFPWRTVRQNVALGLELLRRPAAETRQRVQRQLELVGLTAFAEHYPHQLSGGMKQRCSMARALAVDPLLLLMDEPLSALDAQTRTLLQGELMRLWEATGKSILYVTHSLEEAVFLGHRIAVLSRRPGRLREVLTVPLPHPRREDMRAAPEFAATVQRCWALIRDEARQALLEAPGPG